MQEDVKHSAKHSTDQLARINYEHNKLVRPEHEQKAGMTQMSHWDLPRLKNRSQQQSLTSLRAIERATIASSMYTTIISILAANLAHAAPVSRRDSPDGIYHGVGLAVVTSPPGQPEVHSPAPVELNILTSLHNVSAYKLEIQDNVAPNVDVSQVECRAYKDDSGQLSGSAPFNYKSPAFLATNPVVVGSVLCYIVTQAEAAEF